jgi:glutamine synthetase adenylyltransferase
VHGGLVNVEFIAQFSHLMHAHGYPDVLDRSTIGAFFRLAQYGLLAEGDIAKPLKAARFYHRLT